MKSEKKFHTPVHVAAKLRSGAGPHRATRVECPCFWCGEDTGGHGKVFCSDKCDQEAFSMVVVDLVLDPDEE